MRGLDVYLLNPVQYSQKISERRQNTTELLAHRFHGPKIGTSTASNAIMTRSGARCLWTSIRRPCGFSESFWQRFCEGFWCVGSQAHCRLWYRFALTQDVFWTSTRKPCGLPTTKLSVGSGGHPWSRQASRDLWGSRVRANSGTN